MVTETPVSSSALPLTIVIIVVLALLEGLLLLSGQSGWSAPT